MKYLHGYLPVYKPKGVCVNNLLETIKLDLYFVLNLNNIKHGTIMVNYVRCLEPFSDGLVTFAFGRGLWNKKNFMLANYRYRAVIEFGTARQLHCIDGQVLAKSSVEHLSFDVIGSKLEDFVGIIQQKRCPFYRLELSKSDKSPETLQDYYARIPQPDPKPIKDAQKYPYIAPDRQLMVDSIKLVSYNAPLAEVDISCDGCFTIRQFVADLGAKLDTHACLVELSRLKEGPMTLNDLRVLQIHDLNLEYYIHRMPALQWTYRQFNDDMALLWEESE